MQEVAAGRGHVAQLLRGAGEDRAGEQGIARLDLGVIGEVAIRDQCADAQPARRGFFDGAEWEPRDVDQPRRAFDILLHQVDQVGAAGDEFCLGIGRDLAHRVGNVVGARILEIDHDCPIACWIAATMLG